MNTDFNTLEEKIKQAYILYGDNLNKISEATGVPGFWSRREDREYLGHCCPSQYGYQVEGAFVALYDGVESTPLSIYTPRENISAEMLEFCSDWAVKIIR